MAIVTGSLKDILGHDFDTRDGILVFTPHHPGVRATGVPGQVVPTEPIEVIPNSSGEFTVDLANTATFLQDMWYVLRIHWQGEKKPLIDFPDWQIRVTGDGNISDMITFGGNGPGNGGNPNRNIWWVSADEPPPSRLFTWFVVDPNNPERETPGVPNAVIGDVKVWR